MKIMRFPARWILWLKGCLESASVSILVNGSRTEEFIMERGLIQGDPIDPFLFLIIVEGLNALMRRVVQKNLFEGTKVGTQNFLVS